MMASAAVESPQKTLFVAVYTFHIYILALVKRRQ